MKYSDATGMVPKCIEDWVQVTNADERASTWHPVFFVHRLDGWEVIVQPSGIVDQFWNVGVRRPVDPQPEHGDWNAPRLEGAWLRLTLDKMDMLTPEVMEKLIRLLIADAKPVHPSADPAETAIDVAKLV